jgi:formate/nitrite transporter FocA (FNT family)
MFADQFEADGNGFLYRKYSKGAPIQVSTEERDRYIARFNRFLKYWFWGIMAGTVILCAAAALYTFKFNIEPSDSSSWITISLVFAISMIPYYWAWNIPARELRGRGAVGVARSRAEVRRRYLERPSYSQIAALLAVVLASLLNGHFRENLLLGWNRLWLILGAFTFVMALVLAFRKYRFESQRK